MRCRSGVLPRPQPINGFPKPRRIELYAGRGRYENASVTQSGMYFPNGSPSGKSIPESALRLGRSFRMTPQAESASRNLSSEWDAFSGWRLKRKLQPRIEPQSGMRFPNGSSSESPSRNRPSERDVLSASRSVLLNSKPMRSLSQNWVEESQNETAGGQHDCRR